MSVAEAEAIALQALASLCATTKQHNLHLPGLKRIEDVGIPPLSRHIYDPDNTRKTQAEAMAVLEIFLVVYLYRSDAARGVVDGGVVCAFDVSLSKE
jgi:hypothetical protein